MVILRPKKNPGGLTPGLLGCLNFNGHMSNPRGAAASLQSRLKPFSALCPTRPR